MRNESLRQRMARWLDPAAGATTNPAQEPGADPAPGHASGHHLAGPGTHPAVNTGPVAFPGAGGQGQAGYPGQPQPGQPSQPGQSQPGQTDYPGQSQPGHFGYPGQPGLADQPGQVGQSQPGQTGHPRQTGQTGQSGYPGQPQPDQTGYSGQAHRSQPGQSGQNGYPGQPQPDQTGYSGQPGQVDQPGQLGYSGQQGQTAQPGQAPAAAPFSSAGPHAVPSMSPHPSQASGRLPGGATAHPQGRSDDGWTQAQAGDPAATLSHGAVANGTGGSAAPAGAAPREEGTTELAVRARPPARVATRADARVAEAWPQICERFALQILGHAEHLRPALDQLEADEHDEGRLRWLYQVDHSVTRMRRAARDLRVLAGIEEGDLGGYTSSLMDVIRAAESAIEHYSKVVIGRVVDLAVVPYASDDLSSILAALLDNATNYSPSTVTVSAYLLDSGSVMLRVQDNGIGIPPAHLDVLNAALAGPVPDVNDRTGKHTGFPVIHRLARKHGVTVRLASRPDGGGPGGTIAMVTIPPDLLCEVPEEAPAVGGPVEPDLAPEPASPSQPSGSPERPVSPYAGGSGASSHLTLARPSEFSDGWKASLPAPVSRTVGGLPRRTRTSLRGEGGRSRSRSGAETSAAARSFADDLTAFTAGDQAARSSRSERPTAGGGEPPAPAEQEPEGRPAEAQEPPDAQVTPGRPETAGRADTSAATGTGPVDAEQARPEGEGR